MKQTKKAPETANRFDERQLLERGRAFQYGYFSLAAAMLVCFFLKDVLEVNLMDDFSAFLCCLWLSAVIFSVTMIVKDAYDGIYEGWNSVIISGMGACGLFVLAVDAVKGFRGLFIFYSSAGTLATGVSLLVVFVVYRIKRRRDKKLEQTAGESENPLKSP